MTEVEWLETANVARLRSHLGHALSKRKCLLIICTYAQRIWQWIPCEPVRELVTQLEIRADVTPLLPLEYEDFDRLHREWLHGFQLNTPLYGINYLLLWSLHFTSARGSLGGSTLTGLPMIVAQLANPGAVLLLNRLSESTPSAVATYHEQCSVLRSIILDAFGNPFRPVAFNPAWRTDTAVALARTMYDSREFGAMPILADALQDAGCEDEQVLNHCRAANQVHVRGCWVCDLVLSLG